MGGRPLIDVHHHFIPSEYREALIRLGQERPDGIPAIPEWSEAEAVEFIDKLGIGTAFLSISSPGVLLDGVHAKELARATNETANAIIARNLGRFGGFATLPMPDVESSLDEMRYALDELRLDGVVLLTHYRGTYLGDPDLVPVFDALNEREATVFIHPTSPACWPRTAMDLPTPGIEFIFDTTRAVTNLIASGTFDRCPAIRWIVPHAGGALPVLGARLEAFSRMVAGWAATERVDAYLRRLYYDLAGSRIDAALGALLGIADPSRILYGSDWPFTPDWGVERLLTALQNTTALTAEQIDAVCSDNAYRLLPRLR
jgi:predicted TIM-barrel fold metal-dependent hydrolase